MARNAMTIENGVVGPIGPDGKNRTQGRGVGGGWDPTGGDYDWKDGQLVQGTRQSDLDTARYREMGSQKRPAVQLDQRQANESRGLQMGALGMLRAQGDGTAPSASAIMSQRANENAARTMASAAGRGPGASIVANRSATSAAAPTMLAANAQNAGERLGEVSRGQAGYASGTLGAHSQDVQAATSNAQLEAQQRAIEQQRQQFYENLGWDTQNTQMVAAREAGNAYNQQLIENSRDKMARDDAKDQAIKDGLSLVLSDPEAKQSVMSMGSLGKLYRERGR